MGVDEVALLSMKMHNKYPVIKKLLLVQIVSIGIGMLCIYLIMSYQAKDIVSATMAKENSRIVPKIEDNQEMWRAWYALGMTRAFDADVNNFKNEFPIKSIEVVSRDQVQRMRDEAKIIVPSGAEEDSYVMYELDRKKIETEIMASKGIVTFVTAIGILLLILVVYSTLYIRKYIYAPVSSMCREFERMKSTGTLCLDSVRAKGEIAQFVEEVRSMYRRIKEDEKLQIECKISKRVAHDIRSPLAALKMSVSYLKDLPEEQRLMIRSAVQRINDIATDLAGKNVKMIKGASSEQDVSVSSQLLSSLVDSLISEKRLQYRRIVRVEIDSELDVSSYGLFARVYPVEFKRLLSNLINNSVEAAVEGCKIVVSMRLDGDNVMLRINDNGKGIPEDILPEILRRGVSFEKPGGSGLGLSHAKETIELWGGELKIASTLGQGTTVDIMLPKASPPEWFVPELLISGDASIVILDDDDSIHQIWKNRLNFSREDRCIEIYHFTDPNEFVDWHRERDESHLKYVYLCDYEFMGYDVSGLDVIEKLDIRHDAILITSHYEDESVQSRCEELGVKLIPKNLVGHVPIRRAPVSIAQMSSAIDPDRVQCKRIMIVNDEDFMRVSVKFALKDLEGVQIIEAAGVSDALKMFKEHSVDVVLADINLGEDRDGYDILREVRAQNKTTKFYMMSGMPKEDEWPKAQEMGADGYIQLPFESEELHDILS